MFHKAGLKLALLRYGKGRNYKKSVKYYSIVLEEYYRDLTAYVTLLESIVAKNKVHSSRDIDFVPNVKLGSSSEDIKKYMGTPRSKVLKISKLKVDIYYYKVFIGGVKCKVEFHLYKDQLFYFRFSFSDISIQQREEILGVLVDKYGKELDIHSQVIKDAKGTCIFVDNTVNLKIHYFNVAGEFVSKLKFLAETEKEFKKRKTEHKLGDLYLKL